MTSRYRSRIPGIATYDPSDIQFLQDGTGVVVTLDGDVWLVRGLDDRREPRAGNDSHPGCTSR